MKNRIMIAMVLSLAIGLAACGGSQEGTGVTEPETVEGAAPEGEEAVPQEEQETIPEETQTTPPDETQTEANDPGGDLTPTEPAENTEPVTDGQAEPNSGSDTAEGGQGGEETLAQGGITVDGQTIRLGMNCSQIQETGWAPNAEDSAKFESYVLNPKTGSGEAMALYNEAYGSDYESFHIMISMRNESEQPIPLLEGAVDYISIPNITKTAKTANVILPGGLTLESTEDEFKAAYGEPVGEYEDEASGFRALSFQNGDVRLDISWTKDGINEITMTN